MAIRTEPELTGIEFTTVYATHAQMHRAEEEVLKGEETGKEIVNFKSSFAGRVFAVVDKIPENKVKYRIKFHSEQSLDCIQLSFTSNVNCKVFCKDISEERIFIARNCDFKSSIIKYPPIYSITVVCGFCEKVKAKIKEILTSLSLLHQVCDQLVVEYLVGDFIQKARGSHHTRHAP